MIMFVESILTNLDLARNCVFSICFISQIIAIGCNLTILDNVLGYFKAQNLICINIDGFYIFVSMISNGYNMHKTATMIDQFFNQIFVTKTMIIVVDTFAVYFVEDEHIFLNETLTDCNYRIFCNALFAIENFDTKYHYQTKKYDSNDSARSIDYYDIYYTWYKNDANYEIVNSVFDMKHNISGNFNCTIISVSNDNLAHMVLIFNMFTIILINNGCSCSSRILWYMLRDKYQCVVQLREYTIYLTN